MAFQKAKSFLRTGANALLRPLGYEVRSVYSGGRSFSESYESLKKVLDAGRFTVIDIGVASGTPDLYAAFPHEEHPYVLVEANPEFKNRVDELAATMGAVAEYVFCGDHDGSENLYLSKDAYKASKYPRKTGSKDQTVQIPCLQLDTILKKHGLPGPYIIKIDVEGAELDVLRGSIETLKGAEAVIIETPVIFRIKQTSSFGQIVKYMIEHDFVVFDIPEISYHQSNHFMNLANVVFIRKNNALWEQQAVFKKIASYKGA